MLSRMYSEQSTENAAYRAHINVLSKFLNDTPGNEPLSDDTVS